MYKNYAKAYKEIIEILKFASEEDIKKIPVKMLTTFEEKMDKNYEFQYDTNKELQEQELLTETKAILANIFRDYWATTEEREKIKNIQDEERKRNDLKKREKYNPDDLFKNKKKYIKENIENKQLVEIKKETLIEKIINKIKLILKLK